MLLRHPQPSGEDNSSHSLLAVVFAGVPRPQLVEHPQPSCAAAPSPGLFGERSGYVEDSSC